MRQRVVEHGLDAALSPRRSRRPRVFKLDGAGEANLIALACSQPPAGQAHGTLRLLAAKLVELAYVDTISHETVRRGGTNAVRGENSSGRSGIDDATAGER